MSALINFIHQMSDQSFEHVADHFVAMGVNVIQNKTHYMLVVPHDFDMTTVPISFAPVIAATVGTILEKGSNQIACFGFPKTEKILPTDSKPFDGTIIAFEYLPGTLLRVFYDGIKWCMSTNGSPDAYTSYWISKKSVGELFDECLSRIYKTKTQLSTSPIVSFMTPGNTYMFILQHPEMHLENATSPFIYHIGTFDNHTLEYDYRIRVDRIPQPRFSKFSDYANLLEKVWSQPIGYIFFPLFQKNSQSPRYKILSPSFERRVSLLGRTKNLYLRYLECKAEKKEHELLDCFPSIRYYSSHVEKCLREISGEVTTLYIQKFVKRQFDLPINYFLRPIISTLREQRIHVTPESVYQLLLTYHPKRINFILNGLKYISTDDVKIEERSAVPMQAPPIMEFTEEELNELDDALEKDIVRRKIADLTTEEFLQTLCAEELENFLRPRFMPFIEAETDPYFVQIQHDVEHILGLMLGRPLFDIACAYDDDAYLLPMIHDCAQISSFICE